MKRICAIRHDQKDNISENIKRLDESIKYRKETFINRLFEPVFSLTLL